MAKVVLQHSALYPFSHNAVILPYILWDCCWHYIMQLTC